MSFGIEVELDARGVLPAIKKVEQGLSAAEQKARDLSRAASAAFGGLAQALQTESRMLEMATGKSKDYGAQLMALKKLHDDNKISADQYTRALQKMGVEFGHTAQEAEKLRRAQAQQASAMISTGPAPSAGLASRGMAAGGSALMGMAGIGAALGAASTIAGIADSFHEAELAAAAFEDRVTALENKAQKFTSTFGSATAALDAQADVAGRLHTTISETIDIYDAVGDATDHLNLSTDEQLRLTETLGKAAVLSGKSFDSVGNNLQAMSVAFQTGGNAGAQLTKMFKQSDELATQLAENLNMTKGEILESVKSGKLGFQDLVHAIAQGGGSIDDTYGRIKMTNAQMHAQFTETFESGIHDFSDWTAAWKDASDQYDENLKQNIGTMEKWLQTVERMGQPGAFPSAAFKKKGPSADELKADLAAIEEFQKITGDFAGGQLTVMDPYEDEEIKAARLELAEFNAELNKYANIRNDIDTVKGPRTFSLDDLDNEGVTGGLGGQLDKLGAPDAGLGAGLDAMAEQRKRSDEINRKMLDDFRGSANSTAESAAEAAKKIAEDQKKAAQETREAWAEGTGAIVGDLINMAAAGEKTSGEMISSVMRAMAIMMLQRVGASMGGTGGSFVTGLAGAIGGGRNGFDYTANNDFLQLPGFARGGDGMVRGSGSQDSHLLMARVSPGESFHVRTPQQRMAAEDAASSRRMVSTREARVNVIVQSDPREVTAAMGTYEGERVNARLNRKWKRT